MNTPFFIARRYLFSKKSQNVINIISAISVFGILIATAAMVIVISAFNGIEGLVISLFNSFEPDIKIESVHSKTFPVDIIPSDIYADDDILHYSNVIEETVIFKNYDQFAFGTIKGVEEEFLEMVDIEQNLLDSSEGFSSRHLVVNNQSYGFSGYILFQNLGGYIYDIPGEFEYLTVYSPQRNEKIKRTNLDAFQTTRIPISGVFSFNNKVDENVVLIPIDLAREILAYDNHISAIEIQLKDTDKLEDKKQYFKTLLGDDFSVKTAYEQNELIYKTSKSEKWLTIVLLGFIFFLGTFTMVASITMLILEKRENIFTLHAFGSDESQLKKIFFYIGVLVNGIGIVTGLGIGLVICYLQMKFGLLKMEGGMVEYFPVAVKLSDIFLILGITIGIGTIAAYLPSRILIKKTIN